MGRGHVPGSGWTEDDIALVARLWREGQSAGEICGRVGRTRNAVLGLMNRHRARFPRRTRPGTRPGGWPNGGTATAKGNAWTATMIETAQRMWAAGASAAEIGAAIGKTADAVRARASQLKDLFPPRKKLQTPATHRRPAIRPQAPCLVEPETIPAPDMVPVTLMERRANQCCFPLWDHYGARATAESLYCGGAVWRQGQYCRFHHRVIYRPMSPQIQPQPNQRRRAA